MFIVSIRRNADGVIRALEPDPESWVGAAMDYLWTDGNLGCDCNRSLFFARAGGEDDPDTFCGDNAYSIIVRDETGKVLYDETETSI